MDEWSMHYQQRPYAMSETERKILGLWCSYYAYLENIDREHEKINGRTYPFPSTAKSMGAEQARRTTSRRLGLFAENLTEKEVRGLRDTALRFTFEEQMLFAANTGMYEEFMKDLRNK